MKVPLQGSLMIHMVDMMQRTLSLLFGCTSRTAEYRFVFRNLPEPPSVLLDVGCCGSLLALELAKKRHKVFGIDTRRYSQEHPNLTCVQADITDAPFPGEFFDAVIAVSTIEHIGLGVYGDPVQEEADVKAVKQIYRMLKPGGTLIVTTPFAQEYRLAVFRGGKERYYDANSINRLFKNFTISVQRFFAAKSRFNWVCVSREQAETLEWRWHANVALVLTKEKLEREKRNE